MKIRLEHLLVTAGIFMLASAINMTVGRVREDRMAGERSEELLEEARRMFSGEAGQPEAEWDVAFGGAEVPEGSEMSGEEEMPAEWKVSMILEIPSLGMELPVFDHYSEELLKQAVCRYEAEDIADEKLVIAGHSYKSHFRPLRDARRGETVYLEMNEGKNVYIVSDIQEIDGDNRAGLAEGAWDMTLFTCDASGRKRVVVRRIELTQKTEDN